VNVQRFHLDSDSARAAAWRAVITAPGAMVCEIKPRTRTLDQNARLWAMLADIAGQVLWPINGKEQMLTADEWKDVFTASLREETRITQGLRGGFVMLGASTRRMTVGEMTELIELMFAFGAERDVRWSEPVDVPGWYRDRFQDEQGIEA